MAESIFLFFAAIVNEINLELIVSPFFIDECNEASSEETLFLRYINLPMDTNITVSSVLSEAKEHSCISIISRSTFGFLVNTELIFSILIRNVPSSASFLFIFRSFLHLQNDEDRN